MTEASNVGLGTLSSKTEIEVLREENAKLREQMTLIGQQIKELLQQKDVLSRRELEARIRCEASEELCDKFFDRMLARMT